MRKKLPILLLTIVFLLQAFIPAVYAASKNEVAASSASFCPFDTTSEGAGKTISKDTLGWLNKGETNTSIYFGVKNGESVYTGITKQELAKRLYQHNYTGKGFDTLVDQANGLTRNQARSVEQYLIENGPANALNKANSISPNSKYYSEAMQWAKDFVKNQK